MNNVGITHVEAVITYLESELNMSGCSKYLKAEKFVGFICIGKGWEIIVLCCTY